jgi:hypothetical protein
LCVSCIVGFRKRLLEETLNNNKKMAETTVQKMLIIMPESCFCPPKLPKEFIHENNKYVLTMANRAGTEKRDYKTSLYRVRDKAVRIVIYLGEGDWKCAIPS